MKSSALPISPTTYQQLAKRLILPTSLFTAASAHHLHALSKWHFLKPDHLCLLRSDFFAAGEYRAHARFQQYCDRKVHFFKRSLNVRLQNDWLPESLGYRPLTHLQIAHKNTQFFLARLSHNKASWRPNYLFQLVQNHFIGQNSSISFQSSLNFRYLAITGSYHFAKFRFGRFCPRLDYGLRTDVNGKMGFYAKFQPYSRLGSGVGADHLLARNIEIRQMQATVPSPQTDLIKTPTENAAKEDASATASPASTAASSVVSSTPPVTPPVSQRREMHELSENAKTGSKAEQLTSSRLLASGQSGTGSSIGNIQRSSGAFVNPLFAATSSKCSAPRRFDLCESRLGIVEEQMKIMQQQMQTMKQPIKLMEQQLKRSEQNHPTLK